MNQQPPALMGNTVDELVTHYNQLMEQVRDQALNAMNAAQNAGDHEAITGITNQMNEQMQQLSTAYQQQLAVITQQGAADDPSQASVGGRSLYNFPCSLDLALIVYDGDRDGYVDFERDEAVQHAQKAFEEQCGSYNSRKQLLKTSLKLTPAMAPHVYAIGNRCKKVLGIDSKLEFFVYQDDRFNASVYPPSNDRINIILSSGLLERFDDDELCFVIGHELGHTLFEHHRYPAKAIMEFGRDVLSPLHAIKLFSWGRAAELSADRVGLVCCQDFTAAARAFFKLSSGVTSDSLAFQLDEYVRQFVDLSAEMAQDQMDPQDWYSTHPFSPMRIKALEIFQRSETYHELTGNNPAYTISEQEMEEEIAKFMSLMEPAHIDQNAEIGGDIQAYLFMSGYLIALADGEVEQSELETLGRIMNRETFDQCMLEIKDFTEDDLKARIVALSEKLNTYLSPMQKLNMIRDLCLIAGADGEIHANEANVLHNLCHFINIHPDFADQVLHDSQAELD